MALLIVALATRSLVWALVGFGVVFVLGSVGRNYQVTMAAMITITRTA